MLVARTLVKAAMLEAEFDHSSIMTPAGQVTMV